MSRMRRIRKKSARAGSVWKKLLLWGILGVLALVLVGGVGSYLYVRSYLKSDSFLSMLRQSAIDDLNVDDAQIEPLEWDGSGIRCGSVTMKGHELLTHLEAKSIDTEFSRWDLLKRAFVIKSASIGELRLHLAPEPFHFKDKPDELKSWVEKNILPETFRLEKGSVNSLFVAYGVPDQLYALQGTRVECIHDAGSSQYRFDLQGGKLLIPFKYCPEFSLISGMVQFNHAIKRVNIPTCRLTTGSGGYLDIKGDWDGKSSAWNANIVVNGIPASSLLENDWKKHVQGALSGGIDLHGENGRLSHVTGLVRLQDGLLTGLPILDRLALFCDTSRFRQMPLHKASAQFRYKEGVWHVSEVLIESENLVRVEGWLDIRDDGSLDGRIQVGLTADGPWSALPGFADVFSSAHHQGKNGMMWANVNIGGSLDDPSEDLSARLLKAAGTRLQEIGLGKVDEVRDVAARLLGGKTASDGQPVKDDSSKDAEKTPSSLLPGLQDATEKGLKTGSELMNGLMNL